MTDPQPLPPHKTPPLQFPQPPHVAEYLPGRRVCGSVTAQGKPCRRTPRPGHSMCASHLSTEPLARMIYVEWGLVPGDDGGSCPVCGQSPPDTVYRVGPAMWLEGDCDCPVCVSCEPQIAPHAALALADWDRITASLSFPAAYALWAVIANQWHWRGEWLDALGFDDHLGCDGSCREDD